VSAAAAIPRGLGAPARAFQSTCRGGSGGVQSVAAHQVGPSIGQVLQELDEELQGGEQSGVCLEVRIVL